MAIARHKLVDDTTALHYHVVSRCVRRSFLCGRDRYTKRNYNHRRRWIEARLFQLAGCFAVEVHAYAVMSNHLHLVVYYDPTAKQRWSAEDVVQRWLHAFPRRIRGRIDVPANEETRRRMLASPKLVEQRRQQLGSLSFFMKHLKQPIAVRANAEDEVAGHFWEQRFYCGALLTETAVLACMAYVDLNPVRANVTRRLSRYGQTSFAYRLRRLRRPHDFISEPMRAIVSGLGDAAPIVQITLARYVEILRSARPKSTLAMGKSLTIDGDCWAARIAAIGKRQRAYGTQAALAQWLDLRRFRSLEAPLPA